MLEVMHTVKQLIK